MEPPGAELAVAVDVGAVYDRKRAAPAAYGSICREEGDCLLACYEAEDQFYGRMFGVAHAEIFRSAAPLFVDDPTLFVSAIHGRPPLRLRSGVVTRL